MNMGSLNTSLTFYFRISSALPANAVAEIYLPIDITTPASPLIHTFTTAQDAGAEVTVTVTGVALPANEGPIGPF
jgi:hypothetical protein